MRLVENSCAGICFLICRDPWSGGQFITDIDRVRWRHHMRVIHTGAAAIFKSEHLQSRTRTVPPNGTGQVRLACALGVTHSSMLYLILADKRVKCYIPRLARFNSDD